MPRLCNKTVLQCRCACQAVRAVLPQCRRPSPATHAPPPVPPCRSAPDVATNPSDPVLLTCQPSPGRVWKSCSVELCEQPPVRRRLQAACQSPITVSCDFTDSGTGPCNINMTGTAVQQLTYTILQRTSVMADGVRKSLSAAGGTYTLGLFP